MAILGENSIEHVLLMLAAAKIGAVTAARFAGIVAATVLAADISLASSVMAGDFVAAHDKYGCNRP